MEIFKFTKILLNLIGLYDFNNSNKMLTIGRHAIVFGSLLPIVTASFAFCIVNMNDFKKMFFSLYAAILLTIAMILYSVLIWEKMGIRSLITHVQKLVDNSE